VFDMPLAWLLVYGCLFVTFDMLDTTIITDMSKIVHIFFFLLFILISVKPTLHRHRPAANGSRGISGTPLPLVPPWLAGKPMLHYSMLVPLVSAGRRRL
jgi:hypothetical protein